MPYRKWLTENRSDEEEKSPYLKIRFDSTIGIDIEIDESDSKIEVGRASSEEKYSYQHNKWYKKWMQLESSSENPLAQWRELKYCLLLLKKT